MERDIIAAQSGEWFEAAFSGALNALTCSVQQMRVTGRPKVSATSALCGFERFKPCGSFDGFRDPSETFLLFDNLTKLLAFGVND